jgi:hypothetical protein
MAGGAARRIAVSSLFLFLLFFGARAALFSWRRLSEAWPVRHEGSAAALVRVSSAAYVEGLERIRSTLAPGDRYLLVNGVEDAARIYTVRLHLAPRVPILLGPIAGVPGRADATVVLESQPGTLPDHVVVAKGHGEPPEIRDRREYFAERHVLVAGRRDDEIPFSLEVPPMGSTMRAEVRVRGWCQERGGRPCETVRILVDGVEHVPAIFERLPRPDVEAIVSGIGNCDRAGWRAIYAPDAFETGPHTVMVYGLTADGRFRSMGPRSFRVER